MLHGFETCPLTLREGSILRVLKSKVLRIVLAPKREEVTGGCRKFHNEELHQVLVG
jgi:hypothetical protein